MAIASAVLFAAAYMERMAVILCVSAALLDAIDGWFARLFSQCSKLGKLLDPLADKLIITVMYAVIAVRMQSTLIWILFGLMLLREISITILRHFAFRKKNILIASNRLGKIKMVAQTVLGSVVLIYGYFFTNNFAAPVYIIACAMVPILSLAYLSAYIYIISWRAPLPAARALTEVLADKNFQKQKKMVSGE